MEDWIPQRNCNQLLRKSWKIFCRGILRKGTQSFLPANFVQKFAFHCQHYPWCYIGPGYCKGFQPFAAMLWLFADGDVGLDHEVTSSEGCTFSATWKPSQKKIYIYLWKSYLYFNNPTITLNETVKSCFCGLTCLLVLPTHSKLLLEKLMILFG